jgi:hypothetical protein
VEYIRIFGGIAHFHGLFHETMGPLRLLALGSNLAFIVYAIGLDLTPVWLLHSILLPLNGWRLLQARRSKQGAAGRRLDPDLLEILSELMVERRLDAGARFAPSSAGRELYYIIEGAVLVGRDGVRLGPGEIVDSSWFSLPGSVATEFVRCLTNVRLLAATADILELVCNEHPPHRHSSPTPLEASIPYRWRRELEPCRGRLLNRKAL